jgi:hypothetical protein
MPMKEQQRSVYRTAKGKEVDMGKLIQMNELVPAVGNAKVNARGDKLGPGGKIVKRREEVNQGVGIPDQINTSRPHKPAYVPETEMKGPVVIASVKKDVENHDPEGLE